MKGLSMPENYARMKKMLLKEMKEATDKTRCIYIFAVTNGLTAAKVQSWAEEIRLAGLLDDNKEIFSPEDKDSYLVQCIKCGAQHSNNILCPSCEEDRKKIREQIEKEAEEDRKKIRELYDRKKELFADKSIPVEELADMLKELDREIKEMEK